MRSSQYSDTCIETVFYMYVNFQRMCIAFEFTPFFGGGGQGCATHSKKKLHLSNPHNTSRSHVAVFFHTPFQQHTPQKKNSQDFQYQV